MTDLMYVVNLTYSEGETQNEGTNVVGIFTNHDDAVKTLDNVFHKCCDRLGIEELNAFSYQDEDSFRLIDIDTSLGSKHWQYNFFGEITEVITDTEIDIFNDDEYDSSRTTEKTIKVHSLAQITEKINDNIENNGGEPVELIVMLNGNARSRKNITFADEQDESGFSKFEVFNFIDETTQILSLSDLFDDSKTILGKAINMGAVFMVLD